MTTRLITQASILAALLPVLSTACTSNCAPIENGGVLVDVTGIADCTRLSVTAKDSSATYAFDTWPAPDGADAGAICSFFGVSGHTGTFTVTVFLDGQSASSQEVTLERTDACNISGKLVNLDLDAS
jgi:hypothetical protein